MRLKKVLLRYVFLFAAIAAAVSPGAGAAEAKYSMSYIYFGSSASYTSSVDSANGSLDEVSPNYFALNKDGSLKITTAASKSFVSDMHAQNIRVVPFLSNDWDRTLGRLALSGRETLARAIANAVKSYNLDGICVDIENLNEADRDNMTDFVRLLRAYMPEANISVAVAANPWGASTGWQGSYDYAGLAKYADYLLIMAYDEHYQSGSPGAVGSLPFAENSVRYALNKVSPDKIMLGLAFYGRIWKSGSGYPQGYGVSNTKVDELVKTYGGKVTFDSASQTPYATITIKSSDEKPVIGGVTLSAGTYVIWYENEQSLKKKLELVNQYDLRGAGSWSLGQESVSTWNYYSLWLNGCYFSDSEGHWAQSDILNAYLNGWINGVTPASFEPNGSLTRAQAAVMLVRALGLSSAPSDSTFDDTNGYWAQAEIDTAKRYGLVNGVGGNLYRPDEPITREQMAVLLNNIASLYTNATYTASANFTDVTAFSNSWSYDAIGAMSGAGVLLGFPDGSFKPQQAVSRAQMTVLLERLMELSPVLA